jgi:uncharacterized membrane protein YjgN (DUF898 family)
MSGDRLAFTDERGGFFRLVRRGALLELITAGFYRFWLATDIRRSLWSSTSIEGHALEYTGTAKECSAFSSRSQFWCRFISYIS